MNNYLAAIEIGDKISALTHHEGWKIVSEFLKSKREEFINDLLIEKNIEDIYFLQAGVQVIDYLFNELDALIQNGVEARKLQGEENDKKGL